MAGHRRCYKTWGTMFHRYNSPAKHLNHVDFLHQTCRCSRRCCCPHQGQLILHQLLLRPELPGYAWQLWWLVQFERMSQRRQPQWCKQHQDFQPFRRQDPYLGGSASLNIQLNDLLIDSICPRLTRTATTTSGLSRWRAVPLVYVSPPLEPILSGSKLGAPKVYRRRSPRALGIANQSNQGPHALSKAMIAKDVLLYHL